MGISESRVYWNWQRTAVAVIAALVFLQFYRANEPRSANVFPLASRYTSGIIVDAPITVPAHDYVSYKVDFNRRTNLKGKFWTGDKKIGIECLVLDAANFEAWKAAAAYKSIAATGYVPGGKVDQVLGPGIYHIVLSNRAAADSDSEKTVQTTFLAD